MSSEHRPFPDPSWAASPAHNSDVVLDERAESAGPHACESFHVLRASMEHSLRDAIQNLYSGIWGAVYHDRSLRIAVSAVLDCVGATALLVISRQLSVSLYCPAAPALFRLTKPTDHRRLQEQAERILLRHAAKNVILKKSPALFENKQHVNYPISSVGSALHFQIDDSDVCILAHPVLHKVGQFPISHGWAMPEMIVALLYEPDDVRRLHFWRGDTPLAEHDKKRLLDEFASRVGCGLVLMLADVFRDRERRFGAFPPEIDARYWSDAQYVSDMVMRDDNRLVCLQPPWESMGQQPALALTSTLSLDLRKSTYCMEFASSEREFGAWLDHLVEKLRTVAHRHGGIFDKFTGDGALIHFLDKECRAIYHRSAVDAAVHCAVDMQRAVEIHMQSLRLILHHDSALFGAGIAVDVGNAFWSYDHRENPLVVGKGVVGACRVGDKAPRQTIRLTNFAYMSISDGLKRILDFHRKPLATKEASDELKLECWEASVERELPVGLGIDEIAKICQQIKQRYESRWPTGRML